MSNSISLSALQNQVKECIQDTFPGTYWVIAEISELKINRNGHAYLELIEKDKDSNKVIAKARATIWAYTLRMLLPYFETSTNRELTAGLKVLINVSVEFHELYGFSLNIKDIDPAYTLGDIEQARREIILRLQEEGIFDLNKELELPLVIQKIAIISSATAAGYEDFTKQLQTNLSGYKFYTKLFPAVMQGEQTEASIIAALEEIYNYDDFFDVVIIIRGGGARADLMSFDKYDLAANIAQFPLPVLTGIGHEKDVSITDMVSHLSLKTPTAVADFLINHNADFEAGIEKSAARISELALNSLNEEQDRIDYLARNFVPNIQSRLNKEQIKFHLLQEQLSGKSLKIIENNEQDLLRYLTGIQNASRFILKLKLKSFEVYSGKLSYRIKNQLKKNQRKLDYYEKTVAHLDPVNILKKGYSISRINGKLITDSAQAKKGDKLETVLYKGSLISNITDKKRSDGSIN